MSGMDLGASLSSKGVWDRSFLASVTAPLQSYLLSAGNPTAASGLLVEGSLAAGKSFLLRALGDALREYGDALKIDVKVVYINFMSAIESYKSGKSENMIMGLFAMCKQGESCVLLFDNMDCLNLLPQRYRKSMYSVLLMALVQGRDKDRVFVIATVSSSSNIPVELSGTLCLCPTLVLKSLDMHMRKTLLCNLLSNESVFTLKKEEEVQGTVEDLSTMIARKTSGYFAADLVKLVRDMYHRLLIQQKANDNKTDSKVTITYDFAMFILNESLPTSMLSNKSMFSTFPRFDPDNASAAVLDPVGIDDILLSLRLDILRPFLAPNSFSKGGRPCSGILICGPSGCGKTYLAEWIASRGSAVFRKIIVPCADLVNKIVGESERKIAKIFKIAREISPCFIIFDNLDILLGTNNSDGESGLFSSRRTSHKALDRTLSTLLVEIDGISSLTDSRSGEGGTPRVVVIATSSSFGTIDRALKRPGRLEHHIDLSLPTEQQRHELIASTIGNICGVNATTLLMPHEYNDGLFSKERSTLKRLAAVTISKSHSEIIQIVRNACYDMLRIQITRGEFGSKSCENVLIQDICQHLETIASSI